MSDVLLTNSNSNDQEEELSSRTRELLEENAEQVLGLLTQYSQSSGSTHFLRIFFQGY